MEREEVAGALRGARSRIVAELLEIDGFGGPRDQVRAGLEAVVDDLATAVQFSSSGLTDRALSWWKVRVRALGGDPRQAVLLPGYLVPLAARFVPEQALPTLEALLAYADQVVAHAPERAPVGADLHPSLVPGGLGRELADAMCGGDRTAAAAIPARHGAEPSACLRDGLEPALREYGARWQNGELDPAVEHVASRIASELVAHAARQVPEPPGDAPLVALVRAAGDEHSLGQACLRVHLAAHGLRSRVLPGDGRQQDVLAMVAAVGASAVAISCTLTRQLEAARDLVAAIRRSELAAMPVLLGGGMFVDVPQLASQLGADATAVDGEQAAAELARLLGVAVPMHEGAQRPDRSG
jgi:methanogenic corrinoid protein MtbC1